MNTNSDYEWLFQFRTQGSNNLTDDNHSCYCSSCLPKYSYHNHYVQDSFIPVEIDSNEYINKSTEEMKKLLKDYDIITPKIRNDKVYLEFSNNESCYELFRPETPILETFKCKQKDLLDKIDYYNDYTADTKKAFSCLNHSKENTRFIEYMLDKIQYLRANCFNENVKEKYKDLLLKVMDFIQLVKLQAIDYVFQMKYKINIRYLVIILIFLWFLTKLFNLITTKTQYFFIRNFLNYLISIGEPEIIEYHKFIPFDTNIC
jgi:hypothetical protein